jgi:kynurenine 3-monooxygenase
MPGCCLDFVPKMHVCIIGAGPVGLLQSLYLIKYREQMPRSTQKTLEISIYELRSHQELVNPSGQRSINLALSWRGMKALEEVGLLQKVLESAVPMHGRFIHPLKGSNYTQPYSSHPDQVTIWMAFVCCLLFR